MNKYIKYIKKYILIIILHHSMVWFFIEKQGIGRDEVGFFDNFLYNAFIMTIGLVIFNMENIKIKILNFIKLRKK